MRVGDRCFSLTFDLSRQASDKHKENSNDDRVFAGFIIIPAQQTYVAKVGETWIWQGDMWNSYTDADGRNNKAFDYQAWVPLEFQVTKRSFLAICNK